MLLAAAAKMFVVLAPCKNNEKVAAGAGASAGFCVNMFV